MQNESGSSFEGSSHLFASRGAACIRCRECYEPIMEALYDTLVKSCNGEWSDYRSSKLQPTTVLQITFLKDVFSITNGLCLLLQSEKKILEEFPEPLIQLW